MSAFPQAAVIALIVLTFGCRPTSDSAKPGTGPTVRSIPAEAEPLAMEARQMLARQLNAPPEQVDVVQVEARNWPDTSIGCPQPDHAYAQVITPGYHIVLVHGGHTYAYHTGGSRLVYCPAGATAG